MIDIDHFKTVNDRYGHIVGDFVLKRVADKIKELFPDKVIASRYGGEEFILFLPYVQKQDIFDMLEKYRKDIGLKPIVINQNIINITISIGAAFQGNPPSTLDILIESADAALYKAKHGGRNRTCEGTVRNC